MQAKGWLIVDYSGKMRVVRNNPNGLDATEIAFEITVNIPRRNQLRNGAINLNLPSFEPQLAAVTIALGEDDEPGPLPAEDEPDEAAPPKLDEVPA